MPKWAVILTGCVLCPALGVAVLFSAIRIRAQMLESCGIETTPGEGLGIVVAAPLIFFCTLVATGVLYSMTVTLMARKGSAYWAIALAIVAAGVFVPLAVGYIYEPVTTAGCSSGVPSWWPTWLPA